ncbi:DUF1168-domain-containing protein [Auriscalpium vulgare]|uniref:DUF1168-domain-containing protein n=1 Tax=Auriscalpium vulgare TaxID=40419 RepID=A0ACB8S917_9AGAM|nr:DUF1168-domain-containing protein [Auriscalpium vulgare]
MSHSPSPHPTSTEAPTTARHAITAVDRQRMQLERLLKDPAKPAFVPAPAKEKTIRAAREMMKNVQGSSAGAGSGEFHVYKASRRREYERLKLLSDTSQKEQEELNFETRKRQREEEAEARTAKNRAKRQKKKGRAKAGNTSADANTSAAAGEGSSSRPEAILKKKRLVSGKELVFKRPGEDSDEDEDEQDTVGPQAPVEDPPAQDLVQALSVVDGSKIVIHEDD